MAVAKRNVTINEAVFNGHFPNNPVLPGALIVESLAQTGAVALLSQEDFKGKTAYFGGIESAEFRKVVRPGDTMRLEVHLKGPRPHWPGQGSGNRRWQASLHGGTDLLH